MRRFLVAGACIITYPSKHTLQLILDPVYDKSDDKMAFDALAKLCRFWTKLTKQPQEAHILLDFASTQGLLFAAASDSSVKLSLAQGLGIQHSVS